MVVLEEHGKHHCVLHVFMDVNVSHVNLELQMRDLKIHIEVGSLSPVIISKITGAERAPILILTSDLVFSRDGRRRLDRLRADCEGGVLRVSQDGSC